MDLNLLSSNTIIAFLLILFRVGGMMMTAPILNSHSIPAQAKIGLSFAIALIFFPLFGQHVTVSKDLFQFAVVGAQEIILGLMLGFVANLVFVALQMAGDLISTQMGMSVSAMLDPISGVQVPVIGQILFYFGLLLFFSLNAHHTLILALNRSFELLPPGHFFSHIPVMTERFITLGSEMASVALLLAAPVVGVLLVSEIAMGFMAKVMPQMNIFMVGMPLKLALGLITLSACLPFVHDFLINRFATSYGQLRMLFH